MTIWRIIYKVPILEIMGNPGYESYIVIEHNPYDTRT